MVPPELTVTNILQYIETKGVLNKWKLLGEKLCGKDAELEKLSSLSAIIEFWLSNSKTVPHWRSLVWALDKINETTTAEQLMNIISESQQGMVIIIK